MATLGVAKLINALQDPLSLTWFHGREHVDAAVFSEHADDTVVLYNPLAAASIHIVDGRAFTALHGDTPSPYPLRHVFEAPCALVIYCEGLRPPRDVAAVVGSTAVVLSDQPAAEVIQEVRDALARQRARRTVAHGVFLDVLGTGVLLTGKPSIGKSELALELISRGHALVADDAPHFTRRADGSVYGTCPNVLVDFLEVRGLGILNVQKMYGDAATRPEMPLNLIVDLRQFDADGLSDLDRLEGKRRVCDFLGVDITEITLPVAPGRNLAVLVEAAVRNYLLMAQGDYAAEDLQERQRLMMREDG
ncbi:MAG: HPr(Ser) kinase/phosphatase [Pseudomonadota bacterium]